MKAKDPHIPLWRQIQRQNFVSLDPLCSFLELDASQKKELIQRGAFPLNLPQRLAQKIEKKTLHDPILKQFVPFAAENAPSSFLKDPVADLSAALSSKYLQKYEGRVLFLTTGACAMHCRFCFRQKFDYAPLQTGFSEELALLQQDPTIKEVILSGGDPLSLSNTTLKELVDRISANAHVKRIRFHTRFPIGIPERIDEGFLALLTSCSAQVWFIIHSNHPRELDEEVLAALKNIQRLGIPVLNQWVLLKEVNDSLETLQALCERLIDHGIFPYYLHQLDRVEGAAHFEVAPEKGKELIHKLTERLAGYGVPKYVQEIPFEPSKTTIMF